MPVPKIKIAPPRGGKRRGKKRPRRKPSKPGDKRDPDLVPFPLGTYAMKIQKMLANPKHRTWHVLMTLWDETWHYFQAAYRNYKAVRQFFPDAQREQFDKEAHEFYVRFRNYRLVMDETRKTDALAVAVVRGFLLNYKGSGHTVADYLFPMTFVNQTDAVLETMIQANRDFFLQTPKKVWKALEGGVEDIHDVLTDERTMMFLKWGAAIGATVVGGIIVNNLTSRRR